MTNTEFFILLGAVAVMFLAMIVLRVTPLSP